MLILTVSTLFGQECNLPSCFDEDCGPVNVGFSPEGGVRFCENSEIVFVNTSSTKDFDSFIIDWADGTTDTVYTYNNISHVYNIPDSTLCEYPQGLIPFEVCFQGILNCSNGISCASGGYDFALLLRPRAIISGNTQVCVDEPLSLTDLGCHAEDYLWSFSDGRTDTLASTSISFGTPGSYSVTLTATNECGSDTDVFTFNVVGEPSAEASINPLPINGKICIGQVLTFTDLSNQWSNTTWQILPAGDNNWSFTDTLMNLNSDIISIVFKQDRTYTIRLNSSNVCGSITWEEEIEVLDGPTVDLDPPPTYCDMGTYTPSVSYMGEIASYSWTFQSGSPPTSTAPNPTNIMFNTIGDHVVELSIMSTCGELIIIDTVRVEGSVPVSISAPNQYCLGSSADTLTANPPGGVWSGPGITSSGLFNPMQAGVGNHSITYDLGSDSPCDNSGNVTIEVVPSATVSVSDATVCETDSIVLLTSDMPGGQWEGMFVSADGVFRVQDAGVGNFASNYNLTDANGCQVIATASVIVEAQPTLLVNDTTVLCAGGGQVDLEQASGVSSDLPGGSFMFMIDGQPVSNPYTLNADTGTQVLEISYTVGTCSETIQSVLTLVEPQALIVSNDTSLCINVGTYPLMSNVNGGQWSGPGVDASGIVDLALAGDGTFTYTYTILAGTSCEVSEEVILEITDPSAGLSAGPDSFVCEGAQETYQLSGFSPIGGEWSGPEVSSGGLINLEMLEIDSSYTYTYCLESAGFDNCSACASTTFIIRPRPNPSYTYTGGLCIGEIFSIENLSINAESHFWDFGDGTTSTAEELTHTFTSRGTYTILYTAISAFGCDSTITQSVFVSEPPSVNFSLNVEEGCAPLPIIFNNNSAGDNLQQYYVIGNDTIRETAPTDIILDGIAKDSLFEVTLYVSNECGVVSQTEEVLVRPYPIVDIGIAAEDYCSPAMVSFGNATVGNPESWFWDLGNGNTSMDSIPPIQTYTTSNDSVSTYTVRLTSTNMCGEGSEEISFEVFPPDVRAFIDMDTLAVCQYDSIVARSVSTPGSILSWQLYDESGNQISGYDEQEASITFPVSGQMALVLTASRCGSDSDTTYIDVFPAPEVDFDLPSFVCAGDTVTFINQSVDIVDAEWYLDSVLVGNTTDLDIVIVAGKIYDVTLRAFSAINGCPYQLTKQLNVIAPPTASFDPSATQGCSPLNINFDNTSNGGEAYAWTFGDGANGSTEASPSFTFIDPGMYTVTMQVFDAFGCFDDTTAVNIIVHEDPISSFIIDTTIYCQFYDSLRLTNTSRGQIQSQWIFNGQAINQLNPILLAETPGKQHILLVTTNNFGCSDTASQMIDVLPSPIAMVNVVDSSGCQPFIINAQNTSLQFDRQQWLIDGVETSSDDQLIFPYMDAGDILVSLIASNDNGCPNDTAFVPFTVYPKPSATIFANKDSICGVPMGVNFNSEVSANVVDYSWSFSNGQNAQLGSPRIVFEEIDDIEANLVVETLFGCADTAQTQVSIWPQPNADIDGVLEAYCEGSSIFLTNSSTDFFETSWFISDIGIFSDRDLELIIDDAGQYDVGLTVSYNEQCTDSILILDLLNIYTRPIAAFRHEVDIDSEIKGDILFVNQSELEDYVEWDLGDGSFSVQDSFLHEYDINRNILVTLYAISENEGNIICTDSISDIIEPEWLGEFFAPNAFAPDYGPDEINVFTPKGIGIIEYEINIYSPWGKRVWSSTQLADKSPAESWNGRMNGTLNGEELPMGAYSWIANVRFEDGRTQKYVGSVMILR